MTNNELFKIYMNYQFEHAAPNTYYGRVNILKNHFMIDYGEFSPPDITASDINQIYDEMEENGYANNTIYGLYAALQSFFKMAAEYGEIITNPVKTARTIRPTKNNK